MTPRERRQAEVARAKAAIAAHRPTCDWCRDPAMLTVAKTLNGPAWFEACEAHALRVLEAGGAILGDDAGTRAAGLIAKAAVLRVKRGG
jgi:hypothetical protein